MKITAITIISISLLIGCSSNELTYEENEKIDATEKTVDASPVYTIITVEYPETGWGYQILEDGKLAIDQKHIPAIQGYKGFDSKEKAEKTAEFVVDKMKKGIFPPTLSEAELQNLGVL